MVTRFSKRLLSVFLALLMIVTSVPMVTLTAFAAEDSAEVLFYDFCGSNPGTYDDNDKGRVVDVSKHTSSVNSYAPVSSSNGYTLSFNYKPVNVGSGTIINIGAATTENANRTYFQLLEDGRLFYCWDINLNGDNYFDASGVFGDQLKADVWQEIKIVVTPVDGYDVIDIYVDNVKTKTIDLTKSNVAEAGVDGMAKIAGKSVSAYLAEERPVMYGTGVTDYGWPANDSGYIDDVIIRTNGVATIDMLTEAMSDYEKKMSDAAEDGTVYMNMRAAYLAYVEANKVYDAYYYGNKTDIDVTTAYWHMHLTTLNMDPWVPYDSSTNTTYGSFDEDKTVDFLAGTDYSTFYKNVLYAGKGGSFERANDTISNFKATIYYPDTTLIYDGKVAPTTAVVLGYVKTYALALNRPLYYASLNTEGLSLVNSDVWYGTDGSKNWAWGYSNQINNSSGRVSANSGTSSNISITTSQVYWFNMFKVDDNVFSSGELFKEFTPTFTVSSYVGTHTLNGNEPIRVLNYEYILDVINANKSRLANVTNYRQGGADVFLRGFDRLIKNPTSFFTETNDYTACKENYEGAIADISVQSTAKEPNYALIREAMTTKFLNPDTNDYSSPMERYNGLKKGNYTQESWDVFAAAYEAAQTAMANVVDNDYAPVDASIATNLTAAFEALRVPDVNVEPPTFNPVAGTAIGPDSSVSILSDIEDAVIKYKVVYDGAPAPDPSEVVEVYTDSIVPFNGSSSHSTATVYATATANGETSLMAIAEYTIINAPVMSVETGTAIAPDAKISVTPAEGQQGAIEYCINNSNNWIAYTSEIVPFDGLNSAEVTVSARQLVNGTYSAVASATYVRATSSDLAITTENGNKVGTTSTITITDPENIDSAIKYTMNVNGEVKVDAETYSAPVALSDFDDIEYIIVTAWRDYQGESSAVRKVFISEDLDTLAFRESFDNTSINGLTFSSTPDFGSNYSGKFTEESGSVVEGAGNIDGNANGYNWSSGWRENALKINANTSLSQHLEIANPISSREANKVAALNNGITLSYWRYVENNGVVVSDITDGSNWYTGLGFKTQDANDEYFLATMSGWTTLLNKDASYQDFHPDQQDKTQNAAGNFSGQWMNIVVTVNPNIENNNIIVYTNGVPHDVTYYGNCGGNTKDVANKILELVTRDDTVLTIGDNGKDYWANNYDTYIDDIRVYTEVLTQVDINNMYTDEYADVQTGRAVAHDPTAVTVYTLADGRTVGQEYIDANPGTAYVKIDYYMFGTGMTVYHSDDAYTWTVVGDDQGRCGYQNQALFGAEYTTALAGPLGWAASSAENCPGAGYLVWAPHVMYNTSINKWCFYGSTSAWGAFQSEVFMGTSDNITGPYTNITSIARSEFDANKSWNENGAGVNAIDPATFYAQDGTLYLVYGSYQSGIALKKLNADGTAKGGNAMLVANKSASLDDGGVVMLTTVDGIGSGEGAFVKYENGYYYLYVAYGGNGWGYTQRVFRSKNPEGPYVGINGVEATSTINNDEKMRGNQFMSSYLIQGNDWINSGTAHNSLFNVQNDKGEIVTLNAVHSRPLATEQTDKMNAIEDGALATRQKDYSGNNTVINMVGYTESGWPVSFPLDYNGTDSLNLGNVTARDLSGIYAGNKFDMGLAWNTYNGLYTFRMVAADDKTGVLYGTEYNGTLFTYDFEIINYGSNSWVRFKNSDGNVVREATVATQVKDGTLVYELGVINCDATSESYGKQVWCYKGQDLPDINAAESAGDIVDMDQIIYTHLANDLYYKYGQEISDNLEYDAINHNYGERATRLRVKYPYYIDTSNPGSIYCYSDEQICAETGCSGSGMYLELINDVKGEYREYILKGYVSDYFKYNADTESYTTDGVILLITYINEEDGRSYSEFEFPFVKPNPAMAHTINALRNTNNGGAFGKDARIGVSIYSRFIGSEGKSTDVLSSETYSLDTFTSRNSDAFTASGTTAPTFSTGTFKHLSDFGSEESLKTENYSSPSAIADQFDFFTKEEGVNAGSYGSAEHSNHASYAYTITSNVVEADYYLDYSNPDNPIINRTSDGTPTGYSIDFMVSNLAWVTKCTDNNAATSYLRNDTGLTADIQLLAYNSSDSADWNSTMSGAATNQDVLGYGDASYGRRVMSGYWNDPAGYNDSAYMTGLEKAFQYMSLEKEGSEQANSWQGKITLTGRDTVAKRTDDSTAESYSNFIFEKGTYGGGTAVGENYYGGEEVYAYYNVGVSTCDKGAVRDFLESFANREINIIRDKSGRIVDLIPGEELLGGDYSAASYRAYLRTLAQAYYFIENQYNMTYIDEDGAVKEYESAYALKADGERHALIYTDEVGENIFRDGETSTDPVQAQLIHDIIDSYEVLFTKDTFTDYQQRINDAQEFVDLIAADGMYTDATVTAFNDFLGEASKYFEYYLDKENPVEDQDYWRYTILTGQDYKDLVDLVTSYKRSLMPVVDSTELQSQIDVKTPLLNDGIFAEDASGEQIQVKTMSSWINMDNAVNKAMQDKIDTAGNARFETLEPETIVLDNKEYTFAEPDINTLSADQILVNDDTDVVKATELKDCDASDRYVSYDAVVDVVSAMERDRYTPEALAEFDAFVDQLTNGTDLTKPSVYVLATDDIAANYNNATGDNVAAGTRLCATAQDETDPLTTQLLEMLNDLEVNLYTAYLTVQTLDENGDAEATLTNVKYQKYYGEMFDFSSGAVEGAAVTWLVQQFNKGDVDKFVNGEDVTPVSTQRVSTYTGADMLRKADCDMKVTAQINPSESAENGTILKAYNGYGNVFDVIYADSIETAKEKLTEPKMPFYTFVDWALTDTGNNIWIAKPVFESIPTVTITVADGNELSGKKLTGNTAVSGSEVIVSTSDPDFYAWAIDSEDGYQIVSYNKAYNFVANADESYTVVTLVDDKYYVDGNELTAADMCQFANTTDNGMNDDEYLKLKLDNKAPFIYKQSADLGGRRIILRVTSGAAEDDIRAYGVSVFNTSTGAEKKFPATQMAVSGQFSMTFSESSYEKYSNAPYDIQGYVTYSFSYEFNGNAYQINTTDYFDV